MKCNHKFKDDGNSAIDYEDINEMRSRDMYCQICKKHGTREELENEQTINSIDDYLQSLKSNEYYIKTLVEDIDHAQRKISEIDDKITKLNESKINLIPMGIWNENLTRKEVVYITCVYDTEESVIDKKGNYEYFTDISKDILIDSLNKTKEIWKNIILEKESEVNEYINK